MAELCQTELRWHLLIKPSQGSSARLCTECNCFNPLVPEFKIPAEPTNAGDKMAEPRREPTLHQTQ